MKIKLPLFLILFSLCASFFAQEDSGFSAKSANRQTALRYLRLAKDSAVKKDWQKCAAAAKAGNDYDKTVADLWYLMALSDYNNGAKRKAVLPLLKTSLSGVEWVDYNESVARIFYADLLCSTGEASEALRVLDEKAFIFSSDAEYVRIKAYYTLGSADYVEKAREKVDINRRIYPSDVRFAHLFFSYEYKIMYTKNTGAGIFDYMPLSGKARKIADYFITRVPEYDSRDVELEMYAALFAEGEQKTRLLKAFNARGFKSPLFAAAALEDGIINDAEAMNYFLEFMDNSGKSDVQYNNITMFELERFVCALKDENVKKDFAVYLNAYTGTIFGDTNNVLENNLAVVYNRGRPERIIFDGNNDGVDDWVCDLDFGVPRSARFEDKKITVYYGTYPCPVRILFEEVPGEEGFTVFNLADETVSAEIFRIEKDSFVAQNIGQDFFVVDEWSLWNGNTLFDREKLIVSISSMEKPSKERSGAFIRFLMLNGLPYAADYLVGDKLYAHAQFTNPLIRNVDRDGDGIFETAEVYAERANGIVISKEDLDAASQNIWGSPAPNPARYLQMIQIDRNSDTRPDFTEEYFGGGGRISTWDLDYDGNWDSRHTIYPQKEGEPRLEKTELFVYNARNERHQVAINFVDSIPKEVVVGEKSIAVTKGVQNGFYWVGDAGTHSQELNIVGQIAGIRSGIVQQFEDDNFYLQALCIDGNIFARVLEKMDLEANEDANETSKE